MRVALQSVERFNAFGAKDTSVKQLDLTEAE